MFVFFLIACLFVVPVQAQEFSDSSQSSTSSDVLKTDLIWEKGR